MDIEQSSIAYYTVDELASHTGVPAQEYQKFILAKEFETIRFENTQCIKREQLSAFFSLFYQDLVIPKYELTSFLASSNHNVFRTIAQMYGEEVACPASVAPAQGEFLRSLVLNLGPYQIVEIGCFIGISSIWMASALQDLNNDGIIHSIDLFDDKFPCPPFTYCYFENPLEFAKKSLRQANLDHLVRFHKGSSVTIGQNYKSQIDLDIDLLFIDGDHTIQGCMKDFELFGPFVRKGGYILLHDIYPEICGWDGPRHLIEKSIRRKTNLVDKVIGKKSNYEVVEIKTTPKNFGMALIRKLW